VFLLALTVDMRSRIDRDFSRAYGSLAQREDELDVLVELERRVRGVGATGDELDQARDQLRQIGDRTTALRTELREMLPRA
jgi:hypothetical protein